MNDCLAHRGPDDHGCWIGAEVGVALGHRRLSIVELSEAGHQPMISASGRYVLVFNGEIYNHREIRRRLPVPARHWRGNSDTETLLEAIEEWGISKALDACVGMFALGLWDQRERVLTLARDRLGEKPLYYGWQGGTLLFGSELKALAAHSAFKSQIEYEVLPLYMRHGYVPAPWSMWHGIRKLLPGTFVPFQASVAEVGVLPSPVPYWRLSRVIEAGQAEPFPGSEEEALGALDAELKRAVAAQLVADVPVGAFLSGGVDSSLVVAVAQSLASSPVKTFTIGFSEDVYNEAPQARKVADHLGTDHAELYVTSKEAQRVIPSLPAMYDEPLGDSSAIPTYLVSTLARGRVTVALSGDGGDELFAGYRRYVSGQAEAIWRRNRGVPRILRPWLRTLLSRPVASCGDLLAKFPLPGPGSLGSGLAARARLEAALLNCESHEDFYRVILTLWPDDPTLFGPNTRLTYGMGADEMARIREPVAKMMAVDTATYLPDDILVKVDRAAMSVGLETRVPLLDHRLVEFAWKLPQAMKMRNAQGKWILKQLLYRYVPQPLVDRPKMGFGVPVDQWLRGPLKEWAESLLSAEAIERAGFKSANVIRRRWAEHLRGERNWRDSLWSVLMWQATTTKYLRV